jgi:hypothetical protein
VVSVDIEKQFVIDRHEAFASAVVNDDWTKVRKYSEKYGIPIPDNEKVMKAGIYKACQYCTDLSEEVKEIAMQKCVKLGFNPFIEPIDKECDAE